MNVENQNAVEENEVVSIDVEETNNQTNVSEYQLFLKKKKPEQMFRKKNNQMN